MASDHSPKKKGQRGNGKETRQVYAQVTLDGVSHLYYSRLISGYWRNLTVMPTVPTKIAERIGILRLPRTLKIRLVDGKEVYTEAGPVTHSCREIHVSASVVILHRAKLLLGAQALRILELTVSPRTGKVRRVRLKSSALSSAKGGKLHYALARSERPLNK